MLVAAAALIVLVGGVALTQLPSDEKPAFTPDGKRLLYGQAKPNERAGKAFAELVIMDLTADGVPTAKATIPLAGTPLLACAIWSADGRWVACGARRHNRSADPQFVDEVWVMDTQTDDIRQLTGLEASDLEWAPDATELFIASDRTVVYSVETDTTRNLGGTSGVHAFTLSPDGRRLTGPANGVPPDRQIRAQIWNLPRFWGVDVDVSNSVDPARSGGSPIAVDDSPVPTSRRSRRAVRNMALAIIAAIPIVALCSCASDEPTDTDIAESAGSTARAPFGDSSEQFEPGTYFVDNFEGTSTAPVHVTLGPGWENDFDGWSIKNSNGGYFTFNRPDAVFLDSCHPTDGYHPGPMTTLDGLVAALSEQQGWIDVTTPSEISIDGFTGTAFQRTSPADLSDCTRGLTPENTLYPEFPSWENTSEGGTRGWSFYGVDDIETLYLLDLAGTIVILSMRVSADEPAAAHAELETVLDSVRIDPA